MNALVASQVQQVVAAAVIRNKQLLLLQKREHPNLWLFPGGRMLEVDDGKAGALRRQLVEELHLPPMVGLRELGRFSGRGVSDDIELHLYRLRESPQSPLHLQFGLDVTEVAWLNATEILYRHCRMTPVTVKCIEYLNQAGLI